MSGTGMAGQYHRGIGADHHHKGTGQGGNKSMLSYRVDVGVPGYTGYIPSSASIGLPIKGSTEHSGKVGDAATATRLASSVTKEALSKSMYTRTFSSTMPADYVKGQTGGGYWIPATDRKFDGPAKPFIATTTYKTEVIDKAAAPVKAKPVSLGKTVGDIGALGYVSTYKNMVVHEPKTGGEAAAGRPLTVPNPPYDADTGRPRAKVLERCTTAPFVGTTVYGQNFGPYGSDPLTRLGTNDFGVTPTASTSEFNAGTTRATKQIPGYSGFIPAATGPAKNVAALSQAQLVDGRASAKDVMCLSALDQYSRKIVPRYCGFRPQAPENIKEIQPPPTNTTSGSANADVARVPPKVIDNSNFHNGNKGTMSFFTPGQVSISDNGISNAERYYHFVRPREGLPRIYYPSKTTASGYHFSR